MATPTAPQNDDDLIAAGEELFARTAGGIGCSYCHGDDAAGDLLQGAPDVRGVSELQIFDALESRAQMTFLTLTDAEVKAIATYLGTLSSAQ